MLRRLVFSACIAGLVAGLVNTGLQEIRVVPLILQAETYEGDGVTTGAPEARAGHSHGPAATAPHDHGTADSSEPNPLYQALVRYFNQEAEWAPEQGLERKLYTALANVLMAVGFGLLLGAAYSVRQDVSWRQGILWGVGGYAVFFGLPALGLPPELPGAFAAELINRQGWWLLTVLCSGLGLALLVLQRRWAWRGAGVILLVAPHLIGAPHPAVHGGLAPQELANSFIVATAITNAIFWVLLGSLTAYLFKKLA